MPSGWPKAMAPPFGFRRGSLSANPHSRIDANPWAAKASFNSMTSISAKLRPARPSALFAAGTGPIPIIAGSTPAEAAAAIRARGVNPWAFTASASARISAAAPSFTPDALPAVTVPSARNGVANLANCSLVVVGRGCSSLSTNVTAPLRPLISTGVISAARRPLSIAAPAFCCDHRAKAS